MYVMDEILKCECPPGSESYEDEDGMGEAKHKLWSDLWNGAERFP